MKTQQDTVIDINTASELVAAQHAVSCTSDRDQLEMHLEELQDDGAEFSMDRALDIARDLLDEEDVKALLRDIELFGYHYERAKKPSKELQAIYYDDNDILIKATATSGGNSLNDYYVFSNYEAAINYISSNFSSQRFFDNYTLLEGDYYENDDICYDEETGEITLNDEAEPASIDDLVWAESKF